MLYVDIHDAKKNLSKHLEHVLASHETILICRNGKPIAQLREYIPSRPQKLGLLKGKIKISKNFDELPNNFLDDFSI